MDLNNDGEVSKKEFLKVMKHEVDGLGDYIDKYDEDNDGKISRAEFHKVFKHHRESHGLSKPQQKEFFDYLDHDNSGTLSKAELIEDGKRMVKQFEKKFLSFDKNNDGQVKLIDFIKLIN